MISRCGFCWISRKDCTGSLGSMKYKWPFKVVAAIATLFLLALGYAYFIEPRRLVINQQSLMIKGWAPSLDGFKIVAIGDIHGGSNAVDESKLRQIVDLANQQNPDLIVLLGDYVSSGRGAPLGDRNIKMPMKTIAENLAGLNAKYGVVAVYG
jgi:predicted MPP superfamily phosphohydrolase